MNKVAHIWTDGSCHNATKSKGGYGIFIRYYIDNKPVEEVKVSGGSYFNTTSARQEIRAILEALKIVTTDCKKIIIHSDNQYCVNTISKGWIFNWERHGWFDSKIGGLRKNVDLWKKILKCCRDHEAIIELKWLKGHNGTLENEFADALALQGANCETKINDNV